MPTLTIRIMERDETGERRDIVEKTVWVTEHEQRVVVAGMLRVLDFNAAWAE